MPSLRYLLISLLLHVGVGLLLVVNIRLAPFPRPLSPPPGTLVLQARAVPARQLQEARQRIADARERQRQAEEQRKKAEAEKKRLAEEQRQREIRLKQKRLEDQQRQQELELEQQQLAEEQRKRAEAEKKRLAEEQREKAEAEKKRLAEEQREKAEAEKKRLAEEQREKAEAEKKRLAEEQRQLAQQQQRDQTEMERYKGLITERIANKFNRTGLVEGLSCTLLIRLTANGEIVRVSIVESSGSEVFDRRAEAAVFAAAPLPLPESERLSSRMRTLRTIFRPWDE